MPRPRWETLAPTKRARILEAAAQAFATHGFEGASLNQILEAAAVSKGAAYYYFDDKLDLFVTVVAHYATQMLGDLDLSLSELTRATFWTTVAKMYQRQLTLYRTQPWMLRAVKVARTVPPALLAARPLADVIGQISGMVAALLTRGRALGVVRDDIPETLLVALFTAMDDGWDSWLLADGVDVSPDDCVQSIVHLVGMMERAFAPPDGGAL